MEKLEQTGALRILLVLYRNKNPMTISELLDANVVKQFALYNALKKLKEIELIEENREDKWPFRRIFRLTDKGRLVAEKLLEIEDILEK
ncbi:MAG: helix-turn-helix transcriptional regulator [Thermoproteales archaeon]|nr:helix-turn-helix transcriptional regulator [Thermoproteales archaeon]